MLLLSRRRCSAAAASSTRSRCQTHSKAHLIPRVKQHHQHQLQRAPCFAAAGGGAAPGNCGDALAQAAPVRGRRKRTQSSQSISSPGSVPTPAPRNAQAERGAREPVGRSRSQRQRQQQRQQQQQQQHQQQQEQEQLTHPAAAGTLPSPAVWQQEIGHLQALVLDPNKPRVARFVLDHCFRLNGPAAQARFRQLSAADMAKLIAERQQVERQLRAGAHALSAAWRRLQLLAEAVGEQGAVMSEEQLNKEREGLAGLRDRLDSAQALLSRTVSRAEAAGDEAYLARARGTLEPLRRRLAGACGAFLREGVRRVAAAQRVNAAFRKAWAATPPAERPHPAAAEAQRQAQLQALMPLLPQAPTRLLAQYRQAAVGFQLIRDASLQRRPPATGQPTSSTGVFWADESAQAAAAATAAAAAVGQQGPGAPAPVSGSSGADPAALQPMSPPPPPPLQASEAAWQQPPQHMMARPAQAAPLLPHLAKPWVRQQTQLYQQQQQQQQDEGEAGGGAARLQETLQADRIVLPPIAELLQSAKEVERELTAASL